MDLIRRKIVGITLISQIASGIHTLTIQQGMDLCNTKECSLIHLLKMCLRNIKI